MSTRLGWALGILMLAVCSADLAPAQEPLAPGGPGVLIGALEPALRTWYVPQELYHEFGWEQWHYSNYAKDLYDRYTDINLEGIRYYDIYGRYVTRGWLMYDWSQEQPKDFGSSVFKSPRFGGWFSNLVISSARAWRHWRTFSWCPEVRTSGTWRPCHSAGRV